MSCSVQLLYLKAEKKVSLLPRRIGLNRDRGNARRQVGGEREEGGGREQGGRREEGGGGREPGER